MTFDWYYTLIPEQQQWHLGFCWTECLLHDIGGTVDKMVIMELLNLWYRTRTPVITGYVQFLINWNWHLGKIICTVNRFFQCKVLNSSKALSCLLLAGGTQVVACLSWWEASGSLHRACSLAWSYPQEQSFLTVSLGFLGTSQAPSPSGLPAHTDLIALLSSCSQSACSEMNSPLWFILFWEDQPSLNQSYSGNFKITHVRIIETGHK